MGSTSENGPAAEILQYAEIPVQNDDFCAVTLPSNYSPGKQLCAGFKLGQVDACQGDSGGPLFSNTDQPVVYGIVSYGSGCAKKFSPGVYTSVAYYRSWIIETMGQLEKNGDFETSDANKIVMSALLLLISLI